MEAVLAEEAVRPMMRQIENVEPDSPGDADMDRGAVLYYIQSLSENAGNYRIYDEHAAMMLSAVWACVRIISQSLSTIGWHVYTHSDANYRGKKQIQPHERTAAGDIAWFLGWEPNHEMVAVPFRQVLHSDVLLRGNAYVWIETNAFGRISALWRIDPTRVTPKRIEGTLFYVVNNGPGYDKSILTPNEVMHFRGPSPDGMIGYSVIEMARRTFELGLDQEQFGSTFFESGPNPGGVLALPGNLKEEDRQQYRKQFQERYGGAKNAGKVIVLGAGSSFTPLQMNNADAEFISSRRFTVEDVSRWFGVPPNKLGDLTRATFNNTEEMNRSFATDCLAPWARVFESEADIKLFGRVNRGRYWTKLNLDAFLRGDSRTQTENLRSQVTSGLRTVNEGREELDLNPIEGGDTPLIQGAMIPLERAINPPEPTEPHPQEPEPEENEPAEDIADSMAGLFADAITRLLRVEKDKAKRADNRGNLSSWVSDYYQNCDPVAGVLLPVVSACVATFGGKGNVADLAREIALRHNDLSRRGNVLANVSDENRPAKFAKECVNLIWSKR